MFKNPFSFDGRIRRAEYGLSHIICIFAFWIVAAITVLASTGGNSGAFGIIVLFYIPSLWFIWAQGAKRCHDVGNSGWWQLIPFYTLWLIFEDGQHGVNEYGENPKGIGNQNAPYNPPITQTQNPQGGYQGGYTGGHNSPNTTNYGTTENPQNKDGYKDGDLYK